MGLLERIRTAIDPPTVESRYSLTEYISWLGDQPYYLQQTYVPGAKVDSPPPSYNSHAAMFASNGPVFSLMSFRMRVFSQVRWTFQNMRSGEAGKLFTLPSLDRLNNDPRLNTQMMLDVDLMGNWYGHIEDNKVCRMRPDWVDIAADKPLDEYDTEIIAYVYYPGGKGMTRAEDAEVIPASEVIHWFPTPDPLAPWRGMSWLTPVMREINADTAATNWKNTSFNNGATPNMIIKYDPSTSFENFLKAKQNFTDEYEGIANARKTLHLGGGADATVVGQNFQQTDFKSVQGAGETRLANAAGIHAVVVGFAEGMQGSALNAGNFNSARRSTAEGTLHPLWVSAAGAIGEKVAIPLGARLWYDAGNIPFLYQDELDDAATKAQDASTMAVLVNAGFEPESIKSAIISGDWSLLTHTGLTSVQLQPPANESTPVTDTAPNPGRSLQIVRDEHGFIDHVEVDRRVSTNGAH